MAGQLPRLGSFATINLVFPAATGAQPALNPLTSAWRKSYWKSLAAVTGARLGDIVDTNAPAAATPGAPDAPVIPNLKDPTKVPPAKPIPTPRRKARSQPAPVPAPVILGGSTYQPDSAEFVDGTAAKKQLQPLADAWSAHKAGYRTVLCTARTAAIGPANTAMALSQQRADAAKELLRELGVGSVKANGVGFTQPIAGVDPRSALQRSVSCQLIPKS
jgi:outer membrane protein OmpA-like peptidoglycan-associated protein